MTFTFFSDLHHLHPYLHPPLFIGERGSEGEGGEGGAGVSSRRKNYFLGRIGNAVRPCTTFTTFTLEAVKKGKRNLLCLGFPVIGAAVPLCFFMRDPPSRLGTCDIPSLRAPCIA